MIGLLRYLAVIQVVCFFIGVLALAIVLYLVVVLTRDAAGNDRRNMK